MYFLKKWDLVLVQKKTGNTDLNNIRVNVRRIHYLEVCYLDPVLMFLFIPDQILPFVQQRPRRQARFRDS